MPGDRRNAASLSFLVLIPSLAACLAPPPAVTDPEGGAGADLGAPLRREGRWLVDAHGRVVLLHGVNAVWKHAPYHPPDEPAGFTEADAVWLVRNGFNAVRLGVLFAGVMPERDRIDAAYFDSVDRVVRLLAARGIFVQLDFHQDLYHERYGGEGFPEWAVFDDGVPHPVDAGFPGNYLTPAVIRAFDNLWADREGLWDAYAAAWAATAARWSDEPMVFGYDLLNEPWPGSHAATCANPEGCPAFDATLQRFHERSLRAIREAGGERVVWIEPHVIFNNGAKSHQGTTVPFGDANLGFSFHNYCLSAPAPGLAGRGGGPDCDVTERLVFENALAAEAALPAVSLLTEFGASDDLADIARVAALADEFLVGWTYWHYKNWNDPTTSGGATQGLFDDDGDLSTERPKVALLVRPYPQATNGVPLALSFDPGSGEFLYRYAPGNATAPTVIHVPVERHYPQGYRVEVEGGSAVRREEGRTILISADPARGEVVVRLGPST